MESHIIEAAAPNVIQPVQDATGKLVDSLTGNPQFQLLCSLGGGAIILVCITLLVLRKWWPNTTIGQGMQGRSQMIWACAGMALGLVFILPAQIVPLFAGVLASLFQIVLNLIATVFNL